MAPQKITATVFHGKLISQQEARDKGLKRFFNGVPCPLGHIWERRISNGFCAHPEHDRINNTARANARYARQRVNCIAQGRPPRKKTSFNDMTAKQIADHKLAKQQERTDKAREKRQKRATEREALIIRPPGYISRKNAISQGLTRYFTGMPCSRGHICERKVKASACVMCNRENAHAAKKKTPEAWAKERQRLHNRTKTTLAGRAGKKRRNKRWAKESLNYQLGVNLRRRILAAIETNAKRGSAVRDLGCTVVEFKAYIATQFRHGMCWENWGTVWQLDHKTPLADFDLSDRAQFLEACHYTNHQPLFLDEHRAKSEAERLRGQDGRYANYSRNRSPTKVNRRNNGTSNDKRKLQK